MRMTSLRLSFAAIILYFVSMPPAHANVGVPMIFITFPGMVMALIPIILLESYILGNDLTVPTKEALKASALANIATTLVGMPLTWLALVVIELLLTGGSSLGIENVVEKFLSVTLQAPWLIPYDTELHWMMPAATLTLLIPFFFSSWWIECRVVKRMLTPTDGRSVDLAVWRANLVSYGLLALVVTGWLCFALLHPEKAVLG